MTCVNNIIIACTLHPVKSGLITPITNQLTERCVIIRNDLTIFQFPGISIKLNFGGTFQLFIHKHITSNIDNLEHVVNYIIEIYNNFSHNQNYYYATCSIMNMQGSGILTTEETLQQLFHHVVFQDFEKEMFFHGDPITIKHFQKESNPSGIVFKSQNKSLVRIYTKSKKYTVIAKSVKDFVQIANLLKVFQ